MRALCAGPARRTQANHAWWPPLALQRRLLLRAVMARDSCLAQLMGSLHNKPARFSVLNAQDCATTRHFRETKNNFVWLYSSAARLILLVA
jgi:hypothetical protein